MSTPSIIGESDPPKAWIETIHRSLRNYNTAATGIVEFYPVVLSHQGREQQRSRAVVLGNIVGGWLHVRSLWVDKLWRGRGYATQLMAAAERYAIAKGCVAAFLQTASYEARPLYEKLGYRVFAELRRPSGRRAIDRYFHDEAAADRELMTAAHRRGSREHRDAAVCVRRRTGDRQSRHPHSRPMRR